MERTFAITGAVSAFIAVAAGAFAAHSLKERLSAEMLAVFEVGARYQMYHALALLAVAWAITRWHSPMLGASGWCFIGGTILFSGSLYALSLTRISWMGAITPVGGLGFLGGWLCLAWGIIRG